MGVVTIEIELTEDQLDEAGYHHKDDCSHDYCHDDDGSACSHDECASIEDAHRLEHHETGAHEAAAALSDWHETAHGYTIWSGCPQEPCNQLTLDFRKRT